MAKSETSAGGVVTEKGRLLLVQVENLKREKVWTFPKGHLEKGETAAQAALREVEEETGYRCRITGELERARYFYSRGGERIAKTVEWYAMAPEALVGEPDAREILATRWATPKAAETLLVYPSDKKLLEGFLK
jgi:diadenosine hexaphosphate hydrolase (ATP-forming)